MKLQPPSLAPLLRSDLQGDLLATLLLNPSQEHSLTDLARQLSAGLTTVHTEIERLTVAKLVLDRRVGRSRMIRSNPEHPLNPALTELLLLTYGPQVILPNLLKELKGLDRAFLFGAWAARRRGEQGAFPESIDVLLVGAIARRALAQARAAAKRALRQEVVFTLLAPEEWDSPNARFVTGVRESGLLELRLCD